MGGRCTVAIENVHGRVIADPTRIDRIVGRIGNLHHLLILGCDGAKIVIERGNNAGSAKIPSSYWRQAANPYAWLSGFARMRCARRIIGGKRREILQKLLPYSSQIGIDTKDFRGANGDGENAVHGAK